MQERKDAGTTMQGLVYGMVVELVDQPAAVRVEMVRGEGSLALRVRVAADDLGKVIGKQGRTARSLRTIVTGAGRKYGQHCELNFDALEGGVR